MATANDWDTRVARVQEQFNTQLPGLITNYEMKTRALDDLVKQTQDLEDQKGKLEYEIKMADQNAATSDREFLERKSTFPDPFKPSKLFTIQDVTFFMFFMSYFILLVAVSMVVQEKMKMFAGGLVLFFFIVILLYRYI
jgi:hypothetical protein